MARELSRQHLRSIRSLVSNEWARDKPQAAGARARGGLFTWSDIYVIIKRGCKRSVYPEA